jgi:transposase
MQNVTLVGIDLGKHSFHLHGQNQHGNAVFRKKVSRKQLVEFFATFYACTVVMEAMCGSSSHGPQTGRLRASGQAHLAAIRATLRQEQQE